MAPANNVVVEYREFDGTPSLRAVAAKEVFERAKQAEDWTMVAREMQVTHLKADKHPA
jgi:hypothetical protein